MRIPNDNPSASWLPCIGLAFAAFIFNTSEFLPVGLLPDIAESIGESVSFSGLLMTGYACFVAIASLPLTILTARLERRKLMLALLAVFAASHFAVALTATFASLMAARIGVAACHAIFWSIMTPLAARMAPGGRQAAGLAAVMGGSITATVLGVPLGTRLGQLLGWQNAFVTIGAAAVCILLLLAVVLPAAPSQRSGSLASLPVILRRKGLIELYILTAVTMLGIYAAYSYITPLLRNVAGLSEEGAVSVLFIFGLSGILGTVIGARTVDRFQSASTLVPLVLVLASLLLLVPLLRIKPLLYADVVLWGAAQTALCLALQTVVLRLARDAADVATSLYSGIFNIGIGGGAFLGSSISRSAGFEPIPLAGASLVILSILIVIAVWKRCGSAFFPLLGSEHSNREIEDA